MGKVLSFNNVRKAREGTRTCPDMAGQCSEELRAKLNPWVAELTAVIANLETVYGDVFIRRLRAMSIRDRPTAPRSPWQNGYCERAIGSIRRERLDHVVVFGEQHLPRLARTFQSTRTRRRRERYMPLVAFYLSHFLADFIICMCELDFRQARPAPQLALAANTNGGFGRHIEAPRRSERAQERDQIALLLAG
jgi:hypothetical protein